jgi:hypothetical protein
VAEAEVPGHAAGETTRAERDVARQARSAPRQRPRGRTRPEDRPPAPWGSFPLVEVLVLIALVLLVWGFVSRRGLVVAAGLGIGSVAGLELSIREHFAGFRSHTSLLAAAVAFVSIVITSLLTSGGTRLIVLPIAGAVFLLAFWLLRRAFMRRTGGVGFRR